MEDFRQVLKRRRSHEDLSSPKPEKRSGAQLATSSFGAGNSGLQVERNDGNITANFYSQTENAEVSENRACLRALHATNPRLDKQRIERAKGGLLQDAYVWVLDNADFNRWSNSEQESHLLWVKGDPGKGKTMLLCGIINELAKVVCHPETTIVFFFCQAADARINHAVAVIRGLIFMFIDQNPSLISHVRREYDRAGSKAFEDANSWEVLLVILTSILQDPLLEKVYLIIDGLDECTTDLGLLLDLIVEKSSLYPHVKWLVSSRNWLTIEQTIETAPRKERLWLEINEAAVSKAVASFINFKVQILTSKMKISTDDRNEICQYLSENARGTFLWVALVCEEISRFDVSRRAVHRKLREFPAGLDSLYQRMLDQMRHTGDAELCKSVLGICTAVYRPITLDELNSYMPNHIELSDLEEIIGLCGSFLTLRKSIISLVHQSGRDFLRREADHEIYPHGETALHHDLFLRSLDAMNRTLRRDIYNLVHPGYPIGKVKEPDPDPLAPIRYACLYWVDHLELCSSKVCEDVLDGFEKDGPVDKFFRINYLHWIEAMSLMRSLSNVVPLILKIEALINTKRVGKDLIDRVQDARRFILYGQSGIMDWPLQVYAGALIFSPEKSITRLQYQAEEPRWINHKPMVGYHWSPCLQALEHGSPVESVCFSPNSQLVASSCSTGSVKVWDSNSGQCLSNFDVKETWIFAISYLSNSKLLALTSPGKVWDITERLCISNLGSCDNEVSCGAFFPRPDTIVTGSRYGTIKFWSSGNGEFLRKLEGHSDRITNFAFSPDIKCLASGSRDRTIKIWNIDSGKCLHTIDAHEDMVNSLAFSSDFKLFSSCSLTLDGGIKLWETQNWNCITTLHGHTSWVESLEFSHDSKLLVSGSEDHSIKLWDSYSGECLQTFFGHQFAVSSVVFSHDSQILASASADGTVRIWDAKDRQQPRQIDSHNCESELYFSHDSRLLASVAVVEDGSPCEIKIWNAQNGQCIRTLKGSRGRTYSLMFSNNLSLLAEGSSDNTVRVWDIKSAKCMQTFIGTYYVDTFFSENPSLKIFNGTVVSDSFSLYGPNSLTHYGSLQGQSGSIRRFSRFITWHSRCLLWLPPEYRNGPLVGSGDSVSTDSTLCISCSSGRVLLFIFDPAMLLDTLPDVEPVTWFDFI